jgi:hypothetical protein
VIFGIAYAALQVWLFGHPVTIDADLANALVLSNAVLLPVLPTPPWPGSSPTDRRGGLMARPTDRVEPVLHNRLAVLRRSAASPARSSPMRWA